MAAEGLAALVGVGFDSAVALNDQLKAATTLDRGGREVVVEMARRERYTVAPERLARVDLSLLDVRQVRALRDLSGQSFNYAWEFEDALVEGSTSWAALPDTRANYLLNKRLRTNTDYVLDAFRDEGRPGDRGR